MRVIAGSARRTQLKTLEGMDTRPTTDRIKETLFNMIAPYLYDSIFLDLFAGSGGIGIEALSRGAMEAVFVEKNPKAMACVKENLQKTHFERKGMTMQMDVMTALYKLEGEKQFDYIFMDPPYNHELEKSVLTYLAESSLLSEEGIIIVEASKETEFDYAEDLGYHIINLHAPAAFARRPNATCARTTASLLPAVEVVKPLTMDAMDGMRNTTAMAMAMAR